VVGLSVGLSCEPEPFPRFVNCYVQGSADKGNKVSYSDAIVLSFLAATGALVMYLKRRRTRRVPGF
jgi:predicted Co/Zn/Cd cation transporter (cation efflux family)